MTNTVHTVTDLRWLGDWSLWTSLGLALLLAGAAWALYWREVRQRLSHNRWVLPTLRALAVFWIVLVLAGPVLHHRRTIGELARILVFVDASKSMSLTDDAMEQSRKLNVAHQYSWWDPDILKTNWLGMPVSAEKVSNAVQAAVEKFDGATRWQRMEQLLLDEKDGILPKLVSKHNVELWAITGGEPQRLWAGEQGVKLPKTFSVKPEGNDTDLSDAIAARVSLKRDEKTAVVLLSDGQHNFGSSPLETARVAGGVSIPVFTIGIGETERPKDLAVLDITSPQTVFSEDRAKGEITIKDDMPPGQSFLVKIQQGTQTVWEKVMTTDQTHRRKVEFDFPVKELIEAKKAALKDVEYTSFPMTFTASISALAGEKDATNNISQFRLRAQTLKRKVLLIDGRPRWEFRYLRNMFERDMQWEVNSLVAGTEVTDEFQHGNFPGELPPTRDALFAYDLIIFGEVPAKLLGTNDLEWIREFVGTRGGGIVFVDGQRHALRSYENTPLGSLFPVQWLDKSPKELPSLVQLTDRGSAFAPMRLVADSAANNVVWKRLQAPHWVATTKTQAGAETLAEAVIGSQKFPAIVMRPFGAGKVLYMGMDETWRWRYDIAEKYQDPFWHQMAEAVMEPSFAVRGKHTALDAGSVQYQAGDTADIRVRLRDDAGHVITKGHPTVTISRDGQKLTTISLNPDDNNGGTFRGKTAALGAGAYEVRLDAGGPVSDPEDMPVEFYVHPKGGEASHEMAELTCNEDLLQQMSRASAGEYFREEIAGKVVNKLDPLSKGRIEESETVLWQSWYWFIPIVILLTAEWILRKRAGLI